MGGKEKRGERRRKEEKGKNRRENGRKEGNKSKKRGKISFLLLYLLPSTEIQAGRANLAGLSSKDR